MVRVLFSLMLAGAIGVHAQSGDVDTGELGGYAGGAAGIGGSHGAAGLTFATTVHRHILVNVETGYFSLGSTPFREPLPGLAYGSSRLLDFNGGVHVRVPVRDNLAPYFILGAGLLHSRVDQSNVRAGQTFGQLATDNHFSFQTGAGVRYYVGKNWGVRPEVKVYLSGPRNFTRLSVGIFYQFQ